MIRKYISGIIFTFVLIMSVTAHADLELLGQGSSTHGTYNLIYDTDLDITWYDYSSYGSWQTQVDWVGGLSVTTAATYASRNGVPLEIISKVILRHQDLKTTQIYLGKISDTEAIRWINILHGK